MNDVYEIRLYDTTLMTFSLESRGIEGLVAEIISIDEANKELLPLDLTPDNSAVLKWLEHRVIPKNRAFVEEILKSLNLSVGNTKGIIDPRAA